MTTPSTAVQQIVSDATKLLVDAAEQSDTVDGLGIDERIKLGHSLVDLWVKSYITLLQAWIGGPTGGPGSSMASEPLPSEVIEVAPRPFPRQIVADGPFARVGLPSIKLPTSAIAFQPAFLPAGITQLRIVLKDYRFIGANYVGSITLTASAGVTGLSPTDLLPDQKVVTVGL